MPILSVDELATMRADATETLPDLCSIQTRTITSDGQGGETEAYPTTAMNVPCRVKVEEPGMREQEQTSKLAVVRNVTVTLAYDRPITPADRIVWNSRTFEVVSPLGNSWQIHQRVTCVEVV